MSVHITINDRPLIVEKGITILEAARMNQIAIPTLCDYPGLPPHGSCRLCVVEVCGKSGPLTACSSPVEEGMVIYTHSSGIQALRAELFQMLLADHPSCCLYCPEKAHCDECMVTLRKAGVTTGCRSCPNDRQCEIQTLWETLGLSGVDYPIRYRMLDVIRGDPFIDRDYNLCVLCMRCVRVCESEFFSNSIAILSRGSGITIDTVGSSSLLGAGCRFCGRCVDLCPTGALSEKTRKWLGKPDRQTRSTCPFCSIGCALDIHTREDQVIGSMPGTDGFDSARLCVLGRFGIPEMVHHPDRLKHPIRTLGNDRLKVTWEDALDQAVAVLSACQPDRFSMVVSASCTNEDLYIARKFTHRVMRSNAVRTRIGETYGSGLRGLLGLLGRSAPLSAVAEASTILCLGLDDSYFQSILEALLYQAHQKGTRLITLSPRNHNLAGFADQWLKPEPGQELKALRQFTQSYSDGRGSQELVILIGPSFLTHPDNGLLIDAVQDLQSRSSAKVIVLPAEGNLAGSFLMGIHPWLENDPMAGQTHGNSEDGKGSRVTFLVGEVFTIPRSSQEVIIYQHFISPPKGLEPDLLLPAAAYTETTGTMINYEGRVQVFSQAVSPPEDALPTWQILCRIAQKMQVPGFDFANIEEVQAEIREFLPDFAPDAIVDRSALVNRFTSHASLWPDKPIPFPPLSDALRQPQYMGFPMASWVEGLQSLYTSEEPDPQKTGAGVTIQTEPVIVGGSPG